jgi:HD-GYP domain-containing protein (c-di-GMP phosphodiesterase class II)
VQLVRVNLNDLQEGCILAEDIFSLTNRPIIKKKTVLTAELLEVMKAFFIDDAAVEKTLSDGMPFNPYGMGADEERDSSPSSQMNTSLKGADLFLRSVQGFKKEFTAWQSGMQIDISKIRSILIPLIEATEANQAELFSLYHFSTKADYLYQHPIAVGLLSAFIGKKLNYSKGDIVQIALAGCLADCGMAKISPAIINKKTSLTQSEFNEIKNHCAYSYKMIQNLPLLRESTKVAVFQHHERLDGSGYPFGESDKIHPIAKIIAVADTFHAMTSERQYRLKRSPFKVLEMMMQDDFGKYDLQAIQALGSGLITFSIGSRVRLSDGRRAEILFIEEQHPTRPMIKIIATDEILRLESSRHLYIEEIL